MATILDSVDLAGERGGALLKHRWLGPTFRDSNSGGLGGHLGLCISNKFSGDADAAGPGTTTGELLQVLEINVNCNWLTFPTVEIQRHLRILAGTLQGHRLALRSWRDLFQCQFPWFLQHAVGNGGRERERGR